MGIIAITLSTIIGLFGTTADDIVPDLCEESVYLDPDGVPLEDANGAKQSRYCVWTSEEHAPVWADEVCCELGPDSAHCTPTNAIGGCQAIQVKRWCDFGKFDGEQVTCLQPFPSACKEIECVAPPIGTPVEPFAFLCCYGGVCYEIGLGENCGGAISYCESPYSNEDGSVGCADGE
ncbi:MAG: hypothetical protein KDC95_23490 [Planctomycetes bacterium]|nr:hypothetical protein [Planctomycetota bacterium]